MSDVVLLADGLTMHFPVRGGVLNRVQAHVHALNGVDLTIRRGETVGLVGESGCGKSTLGRTLARLYMPTAGRILFLGQDITTLSPADLRPHRRRMQLIFQDPHASLNPRQTVEQMLSEVLRVHAVVPKDRISARMDELLDLCGLRPVMRRRFPHEFSGGQRQRLGIARALAVEPDLLIADEPVSSLDVSVQAQLLNLLMDLRDRLGLTMLFISHDLKVVEHLCDRVHIMYLGRIVETIDCDRLTSARHPYARALLDAIPIDDPTRRRPRARLPGDVPSPIDLPPGCAFHGRCPRAEPGCREAIPALVPLDPKHELACPVVVARGARGAS